MNQTNARLLSGALAGTPKAGFVVTTKRGSARRGDCREGRLMKSAQVRRRMSTTTTSSQRPADEPDRFFSASRCSRCMQTHFGGRHRYLQGPPLDNDLIL